MNKEEIEAPHIDKDNIPELIDYALAQAQINVDIKWFKDTVLFWLIAIFCILVSISISVWFPKDCNAEPEDFKRWGVNVPIQSKHFNLHGEPTEEEIENINENNLGLGIEYYVNKSTYMIAGVFNNSYSESSAYIGGGKILKEYRALSIGVEGGLINHPDFNVIGLGYILIGPIKISVSYQVMAFSLYHRF